MGTSVLRVEDPALLRGDASFVADLDLGADALVAQYVTSIEAHAHIRSVDAEPARSMPGVVAVLTAADLGDLGPIPGNPPAHPAGTDRPLLASDTVRFVGDPIAVVVAETLSQAADAVEAVVVDYDPLPAVLDPRSAIDADTLLFPDTGSNVMVTDAVSDEPVDFSDCEVVVERTIVNQRLAPCPMETRVAASEWTPEGRLIHHASCQGVHPLQKGLMAVYGLEQSDVRVITRDVGGSFGAKSRFYPEDLLLPHLARVTGRPVRWVPSRSADMLGLGHSRAQTQTIRVGGDRDGTLKAIEADILVDMGAYPTSGAQLARNAGMVIPGQLRIDRSRWSFTAVVTNTTPTVAYRGAGRPEGGALVDRAVDLFAAEIGMDPLEVRRLNVRRPDELPWTNPTGLFYDSGNYPEALELMAGEVGYDEVRAEQRARLESGSSKLLGIGLSTFIDRTAGVPGAEYGAVELHADGKLKVYTGSSPYGQGHYTTWAMLVAERTGIAFDEIEVTHGDTDVVPRGGITGGSRSAQKAGTAIVLATENLVDEARKQAAELLEAAPSDVVLDVEAGTFHVAGSPGASTVGWPDVGLALAGPANGGDGNGSRSSNGASTADPDLSSGFGFKCESDYEPEGPTVPYGAYAAVVEVDVDTGEVTLTRMVTIDDAGTILNPMIALGQVHGGVGQGIGQALWEEFAYDDAGNAQTGNFLDYAFPSAAEMCSFESSLTENPSPQNLLGFKGIAESGTIGAVPAIQNAVVDALAHLGVRHIDLPVTPQRVWAAVQEASSGAHETETTK